MLLGKFARGTKCGKTCIAMIAQGHSSVLIDIFLCEVLLIRHPDIGMHINLTLASIHPCKDHRIAAGDDLYLTA